MVNSEFVAVAFRLRRPQDDPESVAVAFRLRRPQDDPEFVAVAFRLRSSPKDDRSITKPFRAGNETKVCGIKSGGRQTNGRIPAFAGMTLEQPQSLLYPD